MSLATRREVRHLLSEHGETHAGTYLCNAALYLSLHTARTRGLKTRATFIHLPLAPQQALGQRSDVATLPSEHAAAAIRLILEQIAGQS